MGRKPIVLSRHARSRSRLYSVSYQQLVETLTSPETLQPSLEGRINAVKQIAGRRIRVMYGEEELRYVIIIATPLDD